MGELDRGAVAMIGALGFEGIWGRHDDYQVLAKLLKLEAGVREAVGEIPSMAKGIERDVAGRSIKMAMISNTIVITSSVRNADDASRSHADEAALFGVLHATATVLARAVKGSVPLAFRGCVSFGEHFLEGAIAVGESIDRCAESLGRADAAMVWLDQRTRAIVDGSLGETSAIPRALLLADYPVPLQGGARYATYAINPFWHAQNRDAYRKALLQTFRGEALDVEIKRQNTEAFLDAAQRAITVADSEGAIAPFVSPSSDRP